MTEYEAMMAGFRYEISKHAEDVEEILELLEKNAGLLSGGGKLLKSVGGKIEKGIMGLGKRKVPVSLGTAGKGFKTGKGIGTKKLIKRAPKKMGWESEKLLRRMDKAGM